MSKYEIYVNEPLGVVVAKMSRKAFYDEVFNVAMRKLLNKYQNTMLGGVTWFNFFEDWVRSFFERWTKSRSAEKSIVTVAKCNYEDGDNFDETLGRYIATDRMDAKIANTAFIFLSDFDYEMREFLGDVNKTLDKLGVFIDKTFDHIEELAK